MKCSLTFQRGVGVFIKVYSSHSLVAFVRLFADLKYIHTLVTTCEKKYLFTSVIVYTNSVAVAHQIYGVAHTINSANYMYFKALEKVLSLNHPQCIDIFTGICLLECSYFCLNIAKQMHSTLCITICSSCQRSIWTTLMLVLYA